MGFVNLQTSFAPLLLLKEMKSKKAQRRKYYASISMSESTITNVTTTQRRRYYVGVSMNESTMVNVTTTQCHRYYASVSMRESIITNVTTTQRRRCCSFDSPGLARNEPTLGKHSQGDSTL